jgi:hypothetical protein
MRLRMGPGRHEPSQHISDLLERKMLRRSGISSHALPLPDQSDPRVPLVPPAFPVTALAESDVLEGLHYFDSHHILGHLVLQLPLDPTPERRTVSDQSLSSANKRDLPSSPWTVICLPSSAVTTPR